MFSTVTLVIIIIIAVIALIFVSNSRFQNLIKALFNKELATQETNNAEALLSQAQIKNQQELVALNNSATDLEASYKRVEIEKTSLLGNLQVKTAYSKYNAIMNQAKTLKAEPEETRDNELLASLATEINTIKTAYGVEIKNLISIEERLTALKPKYLEAKKLVEMRREQIKLNESKIKDTKFDLKLSEQEAKFAKSMTGFDKSEIGTSIDDMIDKAQDKKVHNRAKLDVALEANKDSMAQYQARKDLANDDDPFANL